MANKQENVRERIIDASIKLFLTKGFVGTTTKELTDAAGVAKGTLYWHFTGKDQILEEILEKFFYELWEQAFDTANSAQGGFIPKFKAFYRFITEFAREKKELLLVSSTVLGEIAGTGSVAEGKMKGIQTRAHDFITSLIDQGQKEGVVRKDLDINIQAHIIIANFVGMHLQWCLLGDSFDAVAYARAYRTTMLRGLGVQE
ncbi:MAG: HTH-type transcriptional repressor KstR2 [Syntrophorhabdaceae bacterium PtaU1.Bin034]|nr:MAG: HTH-type transcriptional repressor KstR2 [Syntrophorhabdaceae bacterium PtaU1.Bin034]